MEDSIFSQLNGWRPIVRLTIAGGLAVLFFTILLYGLPGVNLTHAESSHRYIDWASGSDTTDCTDPANPCATISYALGQAEANDTILVAHGTYTENLFITKTVTLKGGYNLDDWSRCHRDCKTTIDGNKNGGGSDRVIRVETTLTETTVLDGLTLTNGNGGIRILLSAVAIESSDIVYNDAGTTGGGMTIDRSAVQITNTVIAFNEATSRDGAIRIICSGGQSPCSNVLINSSIVFSNSSPGWDGIFCSLSTCRIINSIIWGHGDEGLDNVSATWSDIEMGYPGEENISEDPRFVDPDNGDFHLRPDSPCIDAGSNPDAPARDFEGDPRPIDGDGDGIAITDMGVDEFVGYRVYLPLTLKNY
jgi:hypothetical protein